MRILNSSVLNKMPRDHTALNVYVMYGPSCSRRIPYIEQFYYFYIKMNNQNQKAGNKQRKARGKKRANRGAKAQVNVSSNNGSLQGAPVAQSRVRLMTQPQLATVKNGSSDARIRIRHREYIADVLGSTAFSAVSYSINPGLVSTFPWLNQIAQNYESYQFNKLSFEYETYSSTATAGTVILAVDYDAADSAPANKVEALSFHNAVRSAAWQESCFKCDIQDLKKFGSQRYLRAGSLASNLDIKTYDIGNLILAVQGMSGASAIGELYVSYDVDLMTPQLNAAAGVNYSAKLVGSGSVAKGTPLGTSPTITGTLAITASSGTTVTLPMAGQWLFNINGTGTSVGTGATITGTATSTSVDSNYQGTDYAETFVVKTTAPGQTWIIDLTTGNTSVSAFNLRIAPYLYSLA